MHDPLAQRGLTGLAILVASVGISFHTPGGDEITVKTLKVAEPDIEDIAHLLHIHKFVGQYALEGKVSEISVLVEFYNKGEKSTVSLGNVALGTGQTGPRPMTGKFSLQIADLDYLPLAGGKKGHSRVHYLLAEGITRGWTSLDVPKNVFDFSRMSGGGSFESRPTEKGVVPIFWRVAARGGGGGSTPAEVLRNNQDADLMIAYFRFK